MSANRSNDVASRLKVGAERPDGEGTRPNFAPCRASALTGPVRAKGLVLGPLDARQDQMAHEATHIAGRRPQVHAGVKDRARDAAHQSLAGKRARSSIAWRSARLPRTPLARAPRHGSLRDHGAVAVVPQQQGLRRWKVTPGDGFSACTR